ncbi:MAG: Uma2 family endonuclease [Chitinophagales bacterium]
MSDLVLKKYTLLEYLQLEEQSDVKYEYRNGSIYAMAGGSYEHNLIGGNTIKTIGNALDKKDSNCKTLTSDMKVYIESINEAVFPDISVLCGEPDFPKGTKNAITNPSLIIEVLSKSTEAYDRGSKFLKYRQLPSFKEYVLIAQHEPKVESFYRHDETFWRISTALGLDSSIHLYSIDCNITLKEIYTFIKFSGGVQGMLEL